MKKKILIQQFIPSILGISGLYMLFYYLKNGNYLLSNWRVPYLHIVVFGMIFWLGISDKLEKILDKEKSTIKNFERWWLVCRIFLLCIFTGIPVYTFIVYVLDQNSLITRASIIQGLVVGVLIFWLEYRSLMTIFGKNADNM
jgi:hypothetical protein